MPEIQKNVPMPSTPNAPRYRRGYRWGDMEVGDSMAIPPAEEDAMRLAARVWKHRHPGWNFHWHRERGICRVWRTA